MKDNFVDKGMCADFAIHNKGTGNPHVHIMLTLRPLKENGQWGAKCHKAYNLDENGQRIPDGKGGWKNHREDTTDWNDKENVEIWRAAWAAYTNRALESAGRPERIDHRSYKRQGIDKISSVHLGPAASQMEKRGIRTGKIRALQESAALFSFLQANGIQSMQQLHEKIADMNSRYYDLRGKIVKAERRIAILTERGEMWEQYNQYKPIHKQLAKVKPEKREQFEQRHSRELILYDGAVRATAFHDILLHTEKPPYRFPHTAADCLFAEQVAVCAGAGQRQHQNIILYAIDKQPVRENMTFPMACPIAGQVMVTVLIWQRFAHRQQRYDLLQQLDLQATLYGSFVVFFETGRVLDGIFGFFHLFRSANNSSRSL